MATLRNQGHPIVQSFGLSLEDLARRFGRSPSWVSRRLGLVATLPDAIQQLVRDGKLEAAKALEAFADLGVDPDKPDSARA